ncbi:hypothetical protein Hsc_3008 [Herbaspirillum seropedicae]|nr:hypothetical protein Hsc_3008 [Herbaspirillum seropedicae]
MQRNTGLHLVEPGSPPDAMLARHFVAPCQCPAEDLAPRMRARPGSFSSVMTVISKNAGA